MAHTQRWRQSRLQAKQQTIAHRRNIVQSRQHQRTSTLEQRHSIVQYVPVQLMQHHAHPRRQRRQSALLAAEQRRLVLEQRCIARQHQARAASDAQLQLRGRLSTLQQALALEEACIKDLAALAVAQQPLPSQRSALSRTSTRSTVWHLPRSLSGWDELVTTHVKQRPSAGACRIALALVRYEMDREAARQELCVRGGAGLETKHLITQRKRALESILALFVQSM